MKLAIAVLNYKKSHETKPLISSLNNELPDAVAYILDNSVDVNAATTLSSYLIEMSFNQFNTEMVKISGDSFKCTTYIKNKLTVKILIGVYNYGFCEGNNIIAEIAHLDGIDDILFLNNDTEYQEKFIENYHKAYSKLPINSSLSPLIFDLDSNIWYAGAKLTLFGYKYLTMAPKKVRYITGMHSGCSFMINLAAYRKLGGLNEGYFISFDEPEFAHRFKRFGGTFYVDSTLQLKHRVSISLGSKGSFLHDYYYFRNKIIFFIDNKFYARLALVILKILTFEMIRRLLLRKQMYALLRGVLDGIYRIKGEVSQSNY